MQVRINKVQSLLRSGLEASGVATRFFAAEDPFVGKSERSLCQVAFVEDLCLLVTARSPKILDAVKARPTLHSTALPRSRSSRSIPNRGSLAVSRCRSLETGDAVDARNIVRRCKHFGVHIVDAGPTVIECITRPRSAPVAFIPCSF